MKNILVIDDNSAEARHAAEFAFLIAQKVKGNILLANTQKVKSEGQLVAAFADNHDEYVTIPYLGEYLDRLNSRPNDFEPVINEVDASAMNDSQFAQMVNHSDVWMIVKAMAEYQPFAVRLAGAHVFYPFEFVWVRLILRVVRRKPRIFNSILPL